MGRIKDDYKGFEDLVKRIKVNVNKSKGAKLTYIKGVGFKVFSKTSRKIDALLKSGKGELVGVYIPGITTDELVEDIIFLVDEIARGES